MQQYKIENQLKKLKAQFENHKTTAFHLKHLLGIFEIIGESTDCVK